MSKIDLPNIKIILTGKGRVGRGALEILNALKLKQVESKSLLLNLLTSQYSYT